MDVVCQKKLPLIELGLIPIFSEGERDKLNKCTPSVIREDVCVM